MLPDSRQIWRHHNRSSVMGNLDLWVGKHQKVSQSSRQNPLTYWQVTISMALSRRFYRIFLGSNDCHLFVSKNLSGCSGYRLALPKMENVNVIIVSSSSTSNKSSQIISRPESEMTFVTEIWIHNFLTNSGPG